MWLTWSRIRYIKVHRVICQHFIGNQWCRSLSMDYFMNSNNEFCSAALSNALQGSRNLVEFLLRVSSVCSCQVQQCNSLPSVKIILLDKIFSQLLILTQKSVIWHSVPKYLCVTKSVAYFIVTGHGLLLFIGNIFHSHYYGMIYRCCLPEAPFTDRDQLRWWHGLVITIMVSQGWF